MSWFSPVVLNYFLKPGHRMRVTSEQTKNMQNNKTRIICIANQKGGVGKTTTSVNLSASLAAAEKKTLLVDMDPQGNASSGVGVDKGALKATVYDVLINDADAAGIVMNTGFARLDLI